MDEMVSLRDNKKIWVRHLRKSPGAKTLLYLHGGPGASSSDFLYAASKLADWYNVIVFDQRGILQSDKITKDESVTVATIVDDIENLRQIKGLDKICLLGHSYGGFLALQYTLKYPAHVAAVIYENPGWNIIDTFKTIHRNTIPYIREGGDNSLADEIETVLATSDDLNELAELQLKTPEKYRAKAYYNKGWSDDQIAFSKLPEQASLFESADMSKVEASAELVRQKILADEVNYQDNLLKLKDIQAPSLLIRGDHDPVMSREYQQYFLDNAPKGRLSVINDCGHTVHIDNTPEFCAAIHDFLEKV